MAFSTMIRTLEAKKPSLLIDCIHLPISQKDPRFRYFWDGAYGDYYGVFSWDEVRELNEKAIKEDCGFPGWLEKNLKLKKFLENKDNRDKMFIINDYEWESGM